MAALTRSFPFDTGAGGNVTEAQWREMAKHWMTDGIISTVGSAMAVTATTGMVLQVAAGAAFIQGHYGALDAATNVTVSAADPTLPRIDRVVLRLDALANAITAEVVAGTPHASPTAPALTQTSATWEISLATVAVAAATATIVSGNLTDARTLTTPNNGTTQAPTPGDGIAVSGVTVTAKNRQQLANPFRNASFQVAQRGTSVVLGAAAGFTLDGWHGYRGGTVTGMAVSQQTTLADTQGSGYCARVQRVAADSSTAVLNFSQAIPTVDSRRWAGRTATISFRARKGANYSAASSVLPVYLLTGTGTDQNYIGGMTGVATAATVSATLTTSFQTFSATVTLSGALTQLAVVAVMTPVGTAGAADYFEIKDVRIDEGSYALEHVPYTYTYDLLDAQRYFWRCGGLNVVEHLGNAIGASTTSAYAYITHPVIMRATPTATYPTASLLALSDGTASTALTVVATQEGSGRQMRIVCTAASGLAQYRPFQLHANSSLSGYIDFSAEI